MLHMCVMFTYVICQVTKASETFQIKAVCLVNIFRSNRGKCITNIIEEIKQEQIADELSFGIHDYIDYTVQNSSKSNACSKCSSVYKKASRKSPKSLFDSLDHEVNYDPYQQISS